MTVQTVTVLGAGTMGHGIAHAAAAAGFQTRLFDVSESQIERARSLIDGIFIKAVDLGKATRPDADAAMSRLISTTDVDAALRGADLVIEAAPERMDLKLKLFADIER